MKRIHFLPLFLIFLSSTAQSQEWVENANFNRQVVINNNGMLGYYEYIFGQDLKDARSITPFQFEKASAFYDCGHAQVQMKGMYGLIDTLGKMVVPAKYDFVYPFTNGVARVYRDYKFGAVNEKGELIIPIEYDYLGEFKKTGTAAATKGSKWGLIDRKNKTLIPFNYLFAKSGDEGFTTVFEDKGWAHFDPNGKPILDGNYQAVWKPTPKFVVGYLKTGGDVLFNEKMEKVLPEDLRFKMMHKSGKACIVKKGETYGLYDPNAKKLLLSPEFSDLYFTDNDLLVAVSAGTPEKSYVADLTGKKISSKVYDEIIVSDYGDFFEVRTGEKWGLLDKAGKEILSAEFGSKDESTFSIDTDNKRISAYKRGGWGVTDLTGKAIHPFQYADPDNIKTNPFGFVGTASKENIVMDRKTEKVGLIARSGQWLIPIGEFDEFGVSNSFVNGGRTYIPVRKNSNWGVYDVYARKLVIPCKIKHSLSSGLESDHVAYVDYDKDKWGVILYKNAKVFEPGQYEYHDYDVETGYLVYGMNKLKGLMDLNGKIIVPAKYTDISYEYDEGLYFVQSESGAGYIDRTGKVVIPLKFYRQYLNGIVNGLVLFSLNDKSVLVDKKGKIILRHSDFNGPDDMFMVKSRFAGNTFCYLGKYKDDGEDQMKIMVNGKIYEHLGGDILNSPETLVTFDEGLLCAKKNGRFGYLDEDGKEVIPFQYERASTFSNGQAYVKKDGKYFIINRNGKKLDHIDITLALVSRSK